VAGAWC